MTFTDPRERFLELVEMSEDELDLAEAVLVVAAEACPELDADRCIARLDALADQARPAVEAEQGVFARATRLLRFLCEEQGFVGNQTDYYDPRNSFLNEVIERRTGIPITLSIVYLELARRLDLPMAGVGFPGHFLVRAVDDASVLIDVFFGRVVTRDDLLELLQQAEGEDAELEEEHLHPAGAREILGRLLTNLKHVYYSREELEEALGCSERVLLLLPDHPIELRDRGLIYAKLECFGPALRDLERYVELGGPRAEASVSEMLENLRERVQQIH
jgi:regulator of sirC expression with transglutaminase-like and TPR domain